MIKVLQTNLGRSRAAHDLVYKKVLEEGVDLLIVSEPNKRISETGWWRDKRSDVAVKCLNRDIEVTNIKPGNGFLWIQLRDINLFCAYFSPNVRLQIFKNELDGLFEKVREAKGKTIVAGDLNAKAIAWGSPFTDARGELVCEWQSALNMEVINDSTLPTCVTPNGESFIDITMASSDATNKIRRWRVMEDETLSVHKYIGYEITGIAGGARLPKTGLGKEYLNLNRCKTMLGEALSHESGIHPSPSGMVKVMKSVKEKATSRERGNPRRYPYWWNQEVEEEWEKCRSARRNSLRARRLPEDHRRELVRIYKDARKDLRRAIRRAKRARWKDLLEALENDIWGDGYKLVVKEIKGLVPCMALSPERLRGVLEDLFPVRTEGWEREIDIGEVPDFTREELQKAIEDLKPRKAPGPDGVPAEIVKMMWEVAPQYMITCYNDLLRERTFPRQWKVAKLILIPKVGKEMNEQGAFRPLSLIDTAAKLYEILIRNRLVVELEQNNLLSPRQYGFRKGRSTVHAVAKVIEDLRRSNEEWCIMVTLDIKNAFNTASWARIVGCLKNLGISPYLINIISSYLQNRVLRTKHGERRLSAGVPQGSVLGPTLWNVAYDGVLRLQCPEGTTLTAYADDLGVLVKANTVRDLNNRAHKILTDIEVWMRENKLELAPQKTEAIVLRGPRKWDKIKICVAGVAIPLRKEVKYLGIYLDTQGTFGPHIKNITKKAEKRVAALARILPNVGGPSTLKRRMLLGVVHSTILYGAPIWAGVLRIHRYAEMLNAIQRKMLLRVACGYCTVSAAALQVITGTLPIKLLIEERKELAGGADLRTPASKKRIRDRLILKWQEEWDENRGVAVWTREIIPDLKIWLECTHRALSYEITQVLTGHGCFRNYTHRIGKEDASTCVYCGEHEEDTPEHTIIACTRWEYERQQMMGNLGRIRSTKELVRKMVEDERAWRVGAVFIKEIMKTKEIEERRRQQEERGEREGEE